MAGPMELDDTYYVNMSESDLRSASWIENSGSSYEQIYMCEDKAGVILVHTPDKRHHDHDKQWVLEDESGKVETMTVEAFQVCLFKEGREVPERYHGLEDTAQIRFLGFQDIQEILNRWFRPWASERHNFKFLEAMRQCAELYPAFRTDAFYSHVLKVSNVMYHPFELFALRGEQGIQKIPVIWQTPWLRQNVTVQSMESWLLTGVWPMLNCGKVTLSLEMYFIKSKDYMQALSASKRPRHIVHTGGRHRLSLSSVECLRAHPIAELTNSTRAKLQKSASPKPEPNSYKGKYSDTPLDEVRRLLETRDNQIATEQNEIASLNLKMEQMKDQYVQLLAEEQHINKGHVEAHNECMTTINDQNTTINERDTELEQYKKVKEDLELLRDTLQQQIALQVKMSTEYTQQLAKSDEEIA